MFQWLSELSRWPDIRQGFAIHVQNPGATSHLYSGRRGTDPSADPLVAGVRGSLPPPTGNFLCPEGIVGQRGNWRG